MFYKGMKRPDGSVVKKGTKFNTKRKSVNAAILETFDSIGGVNTFVKWAKGQSPYDKKCCENKNLLEFYKIFSKLASPLFGDPIDTDNDNWGSLTQGLLTPGLLIPKINIVVSHEQKEMHDKISVT